MSCSASFSMLDAKANKEHVCNTAILICDYKNIDRTFFLSLFKFLIF